MGTCSICEEEFEDEYFDVEQNKCILHCEKKSKYSHLDSSVYGSFYNALLDVVISSINTEDYLDDFIALFLSRKDIYDLKEEINTIIFLKLFNSEEINKINEIVERSDYQEKGQISLLQQYIFALTKILQNYTNEIKEYISGEYKKYFLGESVRFGIEKIFTKKKENTEITFLKINFPPYKEEGSSNYMNILNKVNAVSFDRCTFSDNKLPLENQECYFDDCTFKSGLNIDNYKTLENPNDVLFKNCKFLEDVEFVSKTKTIDSNLFSDCYFKKSIIAKEITFKGTFFTNTETILPVYYKNICLTNSTFDKKFILDYKHTTIGTLDLKESTFKSKVKIQQCIIKEEANLHNTKFQDLADFYRTQFNKVVFKRTDFEQIAVFSEAEFSSDVDFKYTKFLGKSIFRDTVIKGKLNLRDTIFDDDATFLDITSEKRKTNDNKEFYGEPKVIKVANRETARIIKNSFEKQNNIIEANRFYAEEMEEREEELYIDIKKGKNILDWLIFKIHSISSDHSQSWLLALIWILYFTFMFSFLKDFYDKDNATLSYIVALLYVEISLIIVLLIDSIKTKFKYIAGMITIVISYLIYGISSYDFALKYFSSNINPFGKLGKDITLDMLIFKITIAYLIYQFIVSVRQNTRRS